jgi:beta-lactamase class A
MTKERVTRRGLLLGWCGAVYAQHDAGTGAGSDAGRQLRALEAKAGGRLGVCALAVSSGRSIGHRMDERFSMCSTFKLPLAAVVLREAEQGRLKLDEVLRYTRADLMAVSPVTGKHVEEGGMTVAALAEGAQKTSDNTAANLLVKRLGGPAKFTAMLRAMGDTVTRLDRLEPQMNRVRAGEKQDTTSPRAMAATMARFLAGDGLGPASKERLKAWMIDTQTGVKRIRAGLPAGWVAGDKTGTATGMGQGVPNKYNDVAMIWLPQPGPVMVAAYYESRRTSEEMRDEDQAVLAEVGRIVARWVQTGG